MIAYEKKNKKARRTLIIGCGLFLVAAVTAASINLLPLDDTQVPVFQELPVLKLPDTPFEEPKEETEQVMLPYDEGKIVVEYFDGTAKEVPSVVEFEGVYRPSQGIDIVQNDTAFTVKSALSGIVQEVNEDPLLGKSIAVLTDNLLIIYQSIDEISLKKGDPVKQGDVLGKASTNIYQASLNNHLHLVVEKDHLRVDPHSIFKF